MPKIILSAFVEPELAAIWDYIALDNPDAADDVMDAIRATMEELSRMPGLGRRPPFPSNAPCESALISASKDLAIILFSTVLSAWHRSVSCAAWRAGYWNVAW